MSQVRSLNRVILAGRVGRQPELTNLPASGRELARFSMVTNEGYYNQNKEWQEKAEWHNIVAWGPLAKRIDKSVAKGDLVLVEGKIHTRSWKDKSGADRKTTEISADNLTVLEKSSREKEGSPKNVGFRTNTEAEKDFPSSYPAQEPPFSDVTSGDDFSHGEEDPF